MPRLCIEPELEYRIRPIAARYVRHEGEPIRRIRLHRVCALSRRQPLHRRQSSCPVIGDGMHRAPSALIVRRQQEAPAAVRRQIARVIVHRDITYVRQVSVLTNPVARKRNLITATDIQPVPRRIHRQRRRPSSSPDIPDMRQRPRPRIHLIPRNPVLLRHRDVHIHSHNAPYRIFLFIDVSPHALAVILSNP